MPNHSICTIFCVELGKFFLDPLGNFSFRTGLFSKIQKRLAEVPHAGGEEVLARVSALFGKRVACDVLYEVSGRAEFSVSDSALRVPHLSEDETVRGSETFDCEG